MDSADSHKITRTYPLNLGLLALPNLKRADRDSRSADKGPQTPDDRSGRGQSGSRRKNVVITKRFVQQENHRVCSNSCRNHVLYCRRIESKAGVVRIINERSFRSGVWPRNDSIRIGLFDGLLRGKGMIMGLSDVRCRWWKTSILGLLSDKPLSNIRFSIRSTYNKVIIYDKLSKLSKSSCIWSSWWTYHQQNYCSQRQGKVTVKLSGKDQLNYKCVFLCVWWQEIQLIPLL